MCKRIALLGWLCLALALSACVSIDSRIASERIDKGATHNMAGNFSNRASYSSSASHFLWGRPAHSDNLADLLGVSAKSADRVRISLEPGGALTFRWLLGNEELASKVYLPEQGLVVSPDGAIELPKRSYTDSVGNYTGYFTWSLQLFINSDGDLATIQTATESGVGLLVVVPIALSDYSKRLAVFPRIK